MVQSVKCLPYNHEDLSSILRPHEKLGLVVCAFILVMDVWGSLASLPRSVSFWPRRDPVSKNKVDCITELIPKAICPLTSTHMYIHANPHPHMPVYRHMHTHTINRNTRECSYVYVHTCVYTHTK